MLQSNITFFKFNLNLLFLYFVYDNKNILIINKDNKVKCFFI